MDQFYGGPGVEATPAFPEPGDFVRVAL